LDEQFFKIQLRVMMEKLGPLETREIVEETLRQSIVLARALKTIDDKPIEKAHLRLVVSDGVSVD